MDEAEIYTVAGGAWLGAARKWIQHNCVRGSEVEWGSGELLTVSVHDLEELAAEVARATFRDLKNKKTGGTI